MIRPIMKELALEPFTEDLSVAVEFLDNLILLKSKQNTQRVKTGLLYLYMGTDLK